METYVDYTLHSEMSNLYYTSYIVTAKNKNKAYEATM